MMRVEQLDLVVGQRRGRLVHLDDRGVEADRLGDLDDLLLGDRERADQRAGLRPVTPRPASSSSVSRRIRAVSTRPPRGAARGRARCSRRSVRSGSRLNSWKTVETPGALGLHRVAEASPARRRPRSCRCRAGETPASIFISVDLPAPFSPTRPCTCPARSVEVDVVEHGVAEEALGHPADAQQRRGLGRSSEWVVVARTASLWHASPAYVESPAKVVCWTSQSRACA